MYHQMSVKDLWRRGLRPPDAIDRMGLTAAGMDGKRLKREDLTGPKRTRPPAAPSSRRVLEPRVALAAARV